jgi:hypothetical protein
MLIKVMVILGSMNTPKSQTAIEEAEQKPGFLQYRDHAEDVLEGLKTDGFEKAVETSIHSEENDDYRLQAEVILLAKAARALERQKEDMTERHDVHEAKTALIRYNHAVRNLIWHNPKGVFTDDLTEWLHEATGDEAWAEGIVAGAAGEVAVARAMLDVGGVKSVRFATVDEDRHGMDVVVGIDNGRHGEDWLSIDVKSRNHLLMGDEFIQLPVEWVNGKRYYMCEVGVESHHISKSATLDYRAHHKQRSRLQDFVHEVSQVARGKRAG